MSNNLSIYIHWPFCLSKCPYCDFNSHVAQVNDYDIWLKSYEKELNYFSEIIKDKYIRSIFFGGGTPSLMLPKIVEGVIKRISQLGKIDYLTEITLEANPTSYEAVKFEEFKKAGVNRLSIGVQSLRNEALKELGRGHDAEQAINTIKSARDIFQRVSFDLIYARPSQTLKEWQKELQEAIELSEGHISLYQLTIEKGTPFYKLHKNKELILPSKDETADMYEWTTSYLKSKNYERYEISNYAVKGQECIHNLTYWNYEEYLGIGPGAHSRIRNFNSSPTNNSLLKDFNKNQRPSISSIMMLHKPEKWLESVNEIGHGIQMSEELTPQELIEEFLMMGLRLKKGISFARLENITSTKIYESIDEKKATYYSDLGLLKIDNNSISLTSKGLLLHSYLVPNLLIW